jgi:hypothetical protein
LWDQVSTPPGRLVCIGSRVEHFVAMQQCESLWRSIRSFLIESTSVRRLNGLSVENFFALGINITAALLVASAIPDAHQFQRARKIKNQIANGLKTSIPQGFL